MPSFEPNLLLGSLFNNFLNKSFASNVNNLGGNGNSSFKILENISSVFFE